VARATRSPGPPPPPAEPELPDQSSLDALKLSPEVWWFLVSRGIPLPEPWQVPRWKTPEPRDLPGAQFDPDRVDRVLRAFGLLVHTQGQWAGRPLRPDPWQVAYLLAPVFGWVRWDEDSDSWVRIIRTAEVDVSRKNGKTTLAGGIAIYLTCADDEPGAQVLAVAASKDQAGYCFNPVKSLAEKSPALSPYVRSLATKVIHKASGSYFGVVAAVGDLLHGANVSGAIIDELHVHKTRDVVDAVESGTGARRQPLVVIITTPDDGRPGTIYAEKREYLEKLARGVITDPTFYGVVFGFDSERELAELGLDPHSEEAWKRANPGYGISPTRSFLEAESAKAKETPAGLARFLRLHLGIRTKQSTRYIRLADWDAPSNSARIDESTLAGRDCHGGLDMGSVDDLTALCWIFPDRAADRYQAIWRIWAPEERLPDLDRRTAGQAAVWVREGWLRTTPGSVFDPAAVSAQLDLDARTFKVVTLGYDRWGANDVTRKANEAGMTLVPVSQSYGSLSYPLKEMLRLTLVGRFVNGGNPVLRWMVDNLAVAMDPAGNVKPNKSTGADKIDGVAAAVNGLKECMDAALVEVVNAPVAGPSIRPDSGDFFRPSKRLAI
jgi:phage terminase large subunit-like protein